MSFWIVRQGSSPHSLDGSQLRYGSEKRRGSGGSIDYHRPSDALLHAKRPRYEDWAYSSQHDHSGEGYFGRHHYDEIHSSHDDHRHDSIQSRQMWAEQTAPFFVIRENSHGPSMADHEHSPRTSSPPQISPSGLEHRQLASLRMERTASGLSISSGDSITSTSVEPTTLLSDAGAAQLVHKHVSNVCRHSRHSRVLRTLIHPKTSSRSQDFVIDDDALESIFSAANDLFFVNKLRGRVAWDWSHPAASEKYDCAIVGTTALRKKRGGKGGYETLIVLSSPILKDTKYNRRLLISTFLHEMIHSYLFIMCGRKAGQDGGHTAGFRQIAEIIDDWVGKEYLRLSDMEADLDRFTVDNHCDNNSHHGHQYDAVFTGMDRHVHQHIHHHHPQGQHSQPWQNDSYNEVETYPRVEHFSNERHLDHHSRHYTEPNEQWQWQQRESFGDSRGVSRW